MSANDGPETTVTPTPETAAWALSLPLFFVSYAFACVSQILAIEVTEWAYPLLFWVIIPLLAVVQATISPTARGAALRLASIVVLIALGLMDSELWRNCAGPRADARSCIESLGKAAALALGYAALFAVLLSITRIWRARTASASVVLPALARRPTWMTGLLLSAPMMALVVAIAMQPVLLAAFSSPPPSEDGLRLYSILPSHIKIAVFVSWVGFVVFTAGSLIVFVFYRVQLATRAGDQAKQSFMPGRSWRHLIIRKCCAIALLPVLAFFAYWGLAIFCGMYGITTVLLATLEEIDIPLAIGMPAFFSIAIVGSVAFPAYLTLYMVVIRRRLQPTRRQEGVIVIGSIIVIPVVFLAASIAIFELPHEIRRRYWHRPIHDAIYVRSTGSTDDAIGECRAILEASPGDLNARDEHGRRVLHITNDAKVAEFLVSKGADVNARDAEGRAPLHIASESGYRDSHCSEIVQLLLKNGAAVDATDNEGKTPLHYAAQGGHVQVVVLLLDNGADINARDHSGRTPLYLLNSEPKDYYWRDMRQQYAERRRETIELLQQHGAVGGP